MPLIKNLIVGNLNVLKIKH